ncbi:HYR domain-containing protein [Mucilaginibacter corticis]|uniref:HYR domain-containing protein n=1 Tax=Mucilaginibacter corticis TaxID=2597670 RepID=A0A556MV25_9SPHI|nr:HYR domain-containing protein [Mucilaginibacter corticis]TSJ43786.1 HYR domain-containing protein [Mucilaginibacter corticis]
MKSKFIKITLVLLLAACSQLSYGQCDKTVVLKSSKTNHLDAKGNIESSKDENATITISKSQVTIVPGDDDHTISGAITSKTCEWPTAFKDGKTVVKAKLEDNSGNTQHCTITITGVAGKITLVFEAEEQPGKKIMVVADTFE